MLLRHFRCGPRAGGNCNIRSERDSDWCVATRYILIAELVRAIYHARCCLSASASLRQIAIPHVANGDK